ncbi:ankyrin repeat and KH domain-containing protein 1-like [Acanthaster planci]|uniref:Ankyrin repeat and KH domain-containing protein 1-like n=1 Tax=Acanthaster planci TaxID=133434 RepID=A0A8B8A7L0_ACAPL|nr:ankyrin repeat and KH domain-containing protein 1-like [Acanthaster planci]
MSDEESDGLEGLLLAAKEGDVATFKELLKAGEDVLQKDKNDQTVLHLAARSGAVLVILAGVSKGLTWHINATSKRGLTPLHDACLAGHVKVTNLLLALGADVMAQTKEGYTALLCAAGNGHAEVARLMVGAGCDPNRLVPPIGVNAVHIATWTGQADVLDTLLQLGARPDEIGKTAAEFAAEQDHTECLEILKKHASKSASSQVDEMKILKSKMKRIEEKIRGYFEDKLKEEIHYFEKQLEDQHEEDMSTIIKLQQEVSRLQSILGREQAQLVRGQPLRSPRPDIIDMNRMPTAPTTARPAGPARKHRLSDGDVPDKPCGSGSPGNDSAESANEDERQEKLGLKTASALKDKSIYALVEETSKKTSSMAYLRRQSSEESSSRAPILRSGSAGASSLPSKPLSSRRGRVVTETPPTSPVIKTQPGGLFSDLSPSTSAVPTPPSPDRDRLQVGEPNAPKTRRKSLTMLLRPIFFGDNNNNGSSKKDKSRRRSVIATMPVPPALDSQPPKNKGPSLLQRPLPGIHPIADETGTGTQDE